MTNETLEVMKRRRSTRQFLDTPIDSDKLEAIVDAGLHAPNAGDQAWHFSIVTNTLMIDRLNELSKQYASSCGLSWLENLGKDAEFHAAYHAPAIILVAGDEQSITAVYDTSAAMENLLIAAESLSIASCWCYFITQAFLTQEGSGLLQEFGIPQGYRVYAAALIGYAAKVNEQESIASKTIKPGLVTYIR